MSSIITAEIKSKADELYHGDEICKQKSKEFLSEICLPNGLLPLKDIEELLNFSLENPQGLSSESESGRETAEILDQYNNAVLAYKKGLEIDPNNKARKSGLVNTQAGAARSRAGPSPMNPDAEAFSGLEMWAKLTADPLTRAFLQQPHKARSFLQWRPAKALIVLLFLTVIPLTNNNQQPKNASFSRSSTISASSSSGNGSPPKSFDYDLLIIGAGVGGHGAALHVVKKVLKTAIMRRLERDLKKAGKGDWIGISINLVPTTVGKHGNHDCGSGQRSSTIPLKKRKPTG
ncbi:hypothetical protein FF1_000659 [Malus domestica]